MKSECYPLYERPRNLPNQNSSHAKRRFRNGLSGQEA